MEAKKPEANFSPSIVDTLNQYYEASLAGLISPYKLFDPSGKNPGVVEGTEYRMFKRWWCLDSTSSKNELLNLVNDHCKSQGGTINYNGWCSSKSPETPIYKISVGSAGMITEKRRTSPCSSGEDIGVWAYEKNSSISDEEWITYSINNLRFEASSQ
jgi:hypothetical protein